MGTTNTVNKSFAKAGQNAQVRIYTKARCVKEVPKADNAIYGSCNYYYRPYGMDPIGPTEVYKLKYLTIADMAKEIYNNPTNAKELFERLFKGKETLIDIHDHNWSRWHDFKGRHRGCGHEPPPYYINYGYYYCSRYGAYLYPSFKTQNAREWLVDARVNLQKYLDDALAYNMKGDQITITSKRYPTKYNKIYNIKMKECELMPDDFKSIAFLTHVPAYVDAGLADILAEKEGVGDLIKICCGPRLGEWLDPETFRQAKDAAMLVAGDWIGRLIDYVISLKKSIEGLIKDVVLAQKKLDQIYDQINKYVSGINKIVEGSFNKLFDILNNWKF